MYPHDTALINRFWKTTRHLNSILVNYDPDNAKL
jgi:hypothetical protein